MKNLGAGSARLASLRPGTRVALEGPFGRLSADVRTKRTLTMLASGIVGWESSVAVPKGATELERIADVTSPESLLKVRAYKQSVKVAAKEAG